MKGELSSRTLRARDSLRESSRDFAHCAKLSAELELPIAGAAEVIAAADHLLIGAGAGIGVDSGLPDFRGTEGFWRAYPPYEKLGLSFPSMASPRWFMQDPAFGWGFYGHRLDLYRRTTPHEGFSILRRWAVNKLSHFVFTSNVDGQFQKAEFDPMMLYEVHGSIHHLQCVVPCRGDVVSADGIDVVVDTRTMRAEGPLPRCACGDLLRPNVLMFGDFTYLATREEQQRARYHAWLSELSGTLAIIEVGAGTAVPTVRIECEQLAHRPSATLVRINPREPGIHADGHFGLPLGGLEALSAIDALL